MNCQRVRELLPAYVDGDLEPEDRDRVSQHLGACAGCSQRLAVHRQLVAALPELPGPPGEAVVAARLRAHVMAQVGGRPDWRPLWQAAERIGNAAGWLAVSALAALLVVALAITWKPMAGRRLSLVSTRATATVAGETPPSVHPTGAPSDTAAQSAATPAATLPATPAPSRLAPEATSSPVPPTATTMPKATPGYELAATSYESPSLGFTAEHPAGWQVALEVSTPPASQRPMAVLRFTSDYYAGDTQAIGRYVIAVSMEEATTETVEQAVEEYLRPNAYRDQVEQQPLTVGGEPAIEMNLPWERFGGHTVWVIHEGRQYRLSFTPEPGFGVPGDAVAQGAWEAFLRTFAFTPISEPLPSGLTPTPPPLPTVAAFLPTPAGDAATPLPYQPPIVTSLIVTPGQPPILYAVVDGALYRSMDRGGSWLAEDISGLPLGVPINTVTIDYRHPETMYALTGKGVYRRQNQGAWRLVNTLQATALAVDLVDPNVLWAGIRRSTGRGAIVLKSEDAGRTWGETDLAVGQATGESWVSDILVDPTNPNILWAIARASRDGLPPRGLLFRGGRDGHWERLALQQYEPGPGNGDSCHATGIAYDPNANLLYVGCERCANNGWRLLLVRSPNADAPDTSTIRWQWAGRFDSDEAPCPAPGGIRPLAVDAHEYRSLFLSASVGGCESEGLVGRQALLVSHDGGTSWGIFGIWTSR